MSASKYFVVCQRVKKAKMKQKTWILFNVRRLGIDRTGSRNVIIAYCNLTGSTLRVNDRNIDIFKK